MLLDIDIFGIQADCLEPLLLYILVRALPAILERAVRAMLLFWQLNLRVVTRDITIS